MVLKYPSFVQLNITNRCNLLCKHCFNNSGNKSKSELSKKEILRILDYFLSKKIVCITFGGGEPLLHNKIFEFIEYASKRGGKITLLTNGLLINKETIDRLYYSGIYRVRVSLDGSNEKINDFIRSKGSFKGAIQALKLLAKSKISNIAVMTSVNKYNINDLENIIKLLIKIGINDIKFIPTILSGRAVYNFKEYILQDNYIKKLFFIKEELSKKYKSYIYISVDSPLEAILNKDNKERLRHCGPCLIGYTFLGIKANGDIFACPMLDNVVLGNIRKDDIGDIWLNSSLLNKVRNLKLLKGKCRTCKIINHCGGGCRALSYLYYKDITKPDPYCWI